MTKKYGLTSFKNPMTVILEQRSQSNMQDNFSSKYWRRKKKSKWLDALPCGNPNAEV